MDGEKKGRATEKLNIIAGLSNGKIISLIIIPTLFSSILGLSIIFFLKKTIETVEKYGHKLIFLPSYSPDLNPIEKFWAALKAKIRVIIDDFNTLSDCVEEIFQTI